MEFSSSLKYPNLNFIEAGLGFVDQIPHEHCNCIHCLNNTKPLVKPKAPRIVSKKERKLVDSHAYRLILKNLAQYSFAGNAKAPDAFLIDTSSLVYSSKSGRMRIRESQGNIQVKRHFDEQRRKGQTNLNIMGQVNGIMGISMAESVPLSVIPTKAPKEIAIMTYKDNTEQIVTEHLLSKILQKRKNDPFWDEISHILQIPPEMKHPIQKYKYHYERTEETLQQLTLILQKMGREIDNQEEKLLATGTSKLEHLSGKVEQDEELEINPELKLNKPSSQKLNRASSLMQPSPKNKKHFSMQENSMLSFIFAFDERLQELQVASLQMVAYLEVTSHQRILNVVFEYFLDEKGRLFVCSAKDVILEQLEGNELSIIHDRYQPLDEIGIQELVTAKEAYDSLEEVQLWKICTAVVNECLQIRKIELKLADYKKPTNETLLKIFLKIFPEFKSEQIFSSVNWKNDLTSIIGDIRKKINKIIREDEGIRILRRFNIHFRRTFR